MNETLKLEERVRLGIELGESHFREFKSAMQRDATGNLFSRVVKEICRNVGEELVAFANADGGELLIGVEDDGTITGIQDFSGEISLIESAYITHVHAETPLPKPIVRQVHIDGQEVLYFRVSKSYEMVHLTSDGRCLQRFDRERIPVPAERIQYSRQEAISIEYDRNFVMEAKVLDLDINILESITGHIAPGYSPEKLLQYLDLAEFDPSGLKLRTATLLLFAKEVVKWHPRCSVRILRVDGNDLKAGMEYNVVQDDIVSGNVIDILENAWDTLRPYLARTHFQPNALFRESIIYPEEACREALINAVAHRDYSMEGRSIEIYIFDNRMEIISPGRLLSTISIEDLMDLSGAHQSRNVFTSRVLRELGYMREMGEGIRRIFSSVRDFELIDPILSNEKDSFIITLFHKSIFSPKDVKWLSEYSDFDLSKDEQRVILLGKEGRLLSTAEIIDVVGIVDTEDFRALYDSLYKKGVIYSTGKSRFRRKRTAPRFKIRPPSEAQQFLAEFQVALRDASQVEKVTADYWRSLRKMLSDSSPYKRNPHWAMRALGYVSDSGLPLPRLNKIWQAESSIDELEGRIISGVVTNIVEDRGFAFATSQVGEDFFLHAKEFIDHDDWLSLKLRSIVHFEAAERNIPGKARSAKKIILKKQ